MKERLASEYLAQQQSAHGSKEYLPLEDRWACVVGSNGKNNIGFHVADGFKLAGFEKVSEKDRSTGNALWSDQRYSRFDTLVLANGYAQMDWIENLRPSNISEVIENTLTASIVATQRFVQDTIGNQHRKCLIFIGSMASTRVLNASGPYCAAKAGLAHFARCAAWELTPKGYDVYIVNPAQVSGTPMSEKVITELMRYRGIDRTAAELYWESGLIRPMTTPKDVSAMVVDLALGKYPRLSGTQIDMAGGAR